MNENLPTQNRFAHFRRYYTALEPILEKPRTRIYTAVIFSFLAISLFGWYAIKPTIQTIITLRKEITEKTALNGQMEQKIASLIEAQNRYQDIQPRLTLLDEAIPNNPEAIELLMQVRNLVHSTEATLSSGSVGGVPLVIDTEASDQKNKPMKSGSLEFSVNTALTGGFPELETSLNELMTLRRIVTVQNISISPAKETSGKTPLTANALNMSLQLKSFYKSY